MYSYIIGATQLERRFCAFAKRDAFGVSTMYFNHREVKVNTIYWFRKKKKKVSWKKVSRSWLQHTGYFEKVSRISYILQESEIVRRKKKCIILGHLKGIAILRIFRETHAITVTGRAQFSKYISKTGKIKIFFSDCDKRAL